ncbi:MAG: YMGG-like glycine zipper-containing protein [Acidobacteria bacterium]|nr:YMGG-like glycine zipper-containing protein [Acidobacteriota bacterium]
MLKKIHKSAVVMMLMFGLLIVSAAPYAEAQDRCRRNGSYRTISRNDRFFGNRFNDDRGFDRRRRGRNYYYDREDTTENAIKRTGIGAGAGALGGALLGGKKGALIGAGVGAATGYIIHRVKVDKERDRYYRR